MDLLRSTADGLWCEAGGFFIDPWRPAPLAVLTHAHADHARPGSGRAIVAETGAAIARHRLPGTEVEAWPYGEKRRLGDVWVSLHPAGHVLGSAQVRLEPAGAAATGGVWVVSGDYKRAPDPSCEAFEPVPCDVFVTEATFGLPIYRWPSTESVLEDLLAWWSENAREGRASVVHGYAFGKCQRLLAELSSRVDRIVYVHGSLDTLNGFYRDRGVRLAPTAQVVAQPKGFSFAGQLILAPPSAHGSRWSRRFGDRETALASGWMRVRGRRRRRAYDRGFVLSDHADWPALLRTVEETGARRVLCTHGNAETLARYLRGLGYEAAALDTPYAEDEEAAAGLDGALGPLAADRPGGGALRPEA